MILTTLTLLFAQQASCCQPMAAFASDPQFIASHLAPLAFTYTSHAGGGTITFKDRAGKPTQGYYVPPKPGVKAAVIMVHEWWGLNDYIKKSAERLHDELGVAVLAVDLYEGKSTRDPKEAGSLMQSLNVQRAKDIVAGAVAKLESSKAGKVPIGTIGYCMGGGWSFWTAVEGGANVKACVVYYGSPDVSGIARLKAPVLFIQPTKDKWINDELVNNFAAKMMAGKKTLTILKYDADHAFANPSNPHYDEKNAEEAWAKSIGFFKKQLMPAAKKG